MMAHWQCATWAGMVDDESASEAHFFAGLESGRRFVEAARSGLIDQADWSATVPVGIALSMQGPSTDFVLGRLSEMITRAAFDEVVKRDADGHALPPEDYVHDEAVRAIVAGNLIRRSNCAVL